MRCDCCAAHPERVASCRELIDLTHVKAFFDQVATDRDTMRKRPTAVPIGLFIRQTCARSAKTRRSPGGSWKTKRPCKPATLSDSSTQLKIVVSPVRVRVSPLGKAPQRGFFMPVEVRTISPAGSRAARC